MKSVLPGFLLALVLMSLTWSLGRNFPPLNTDEVILSNHAYNLYTGQTNRYSLYDDLFDQEFYKWRDATAGLLQIVYEAWVGPFVTWLPRSAGNARLSSLTAGFLTLFLWFLIGKSFGGVKVGLAAILIGWAHPLFQLTSLLVRAESFLVLAATATVYLALTLSEDFRWKYPVLGVLAGLQIGIHQNSVPLFLGLFVFIWLRTSTKPLYSRMTVLLFSYLIGLVVVFVMIDHIKFWMSQQFIVYDLYKPPVLSWPWNPFAWFSQWFQLIFTGSPSWYLPNNRFLIWPISIASYWVCLVVLLMRREERSHLFLPLAGGAVAVFIGLACLIRKNEALYGVVLLPFLVPLLAHKELRKPFLLGLLLVPVLGFAVFRTQYRAANPSYNQVALKIQMMIPPDARVAGPNQMWFTMPDENFRDISALVGSRWLTGGKRDIKRWLSVWKPDVLVIEPSWKKMLLGSGETRQLLENQLGIPVTQLGQVETTEMGRLELFLLNDERKHAVIRNK